MIYATKESIKALRTKVGATQEELARWLDVSVQTIRRWEWGKSKPSSLAMQALTRLEQMWNSDQVIHKPVLDEEKLAEIKGLIPK